MDNKEYSFFRYTFSKILKNPLGVLGLVIVILTIFLAIFADVIAPYSPYQQNITESLNPPSVQHWLGQDDLGRDILSRIIFGARISLLVGFITVSVSAILGSVIGAIAGYFGGWIDEVLMRITDILLAFPGILLAIAIMAILGPSLNNVIIALCIVGWKSYARLVRGEILKEKEKEYIQATKALGYSHFRIISFHLIPNTLNPVLVMATLGVASMIISEAGLSFLGLAHSQLGWYALRGQTIFTPGISINHLSRSGDYDPGAGIFLSGGCVAGCAGSLYQSIERVINNAS